MKLILGIVGEMGSGKGTFAEYVKKNMEETPFLFLIFSGDCLMLCNLKKQKKFAKDIDGSS